MSYLLANGCSFTNKNYNTDSHGWMHSIEEKKQLGIPTENWPMWPEYVSDKLELPCLNLAQSGKSNEHMYKDTIAQCHIRKPKVIMHLWSGGWRRHFFNHNLIHDNYVQAIQIANAIIKNSDEIFYWTKDYSIDRFYLALDLLNNYYPENFDKCLNFYSEKSNLAKNMYSLKSIKNSKHHWWFNLALMFNNEYLNWYRADDTNCTKIQMQIINDELKPLFDLYEYCKSENIHLITKCLIPFGGFPSIKSQLIRKIIVARTEFDKMLLGVEKISFGIQRSWKNNYYFKKLDDLVSDKKYIIENWPNHIALQRKCGGKSWVKGWKTVSDKDSHPHWDTQKLIGDIFYDLYKKNYS